MIENSSKDPNGNNASTIPKNPPIENSVKGNSEVIDLADISETSTISIDEIDNIKNFTDNNLIELASGDIVDHINSWEQQEQLNAVGKESGFRYRDIIFALVGIRLPEPEAKRDWKEILVHKYTMSETLGRNVGIHVATLDYYSNIKKLRMRPKIIDANEYVDTASRAMTDELTKAYNRHFFEEEFRRRFTQSRVKGVYFSFIMLDLDNFKIYNDTNGHIQGDLALIETVRILHTVCSWRDIVARYGGEEFAIMLHAQPIEQAIKTAEKIRKAVEEYRFVNEHILPGRRLTVSIGVTTFRDETSTPLELIEEADKALYNAKETGRNRVKSYLDL